MTKFKYSILFLYLLVLNTNPSFSQNKDILVNFINPKKELITDKIELSATIKSNEKVDITSTIAEKIQEILFIEGVSVKKDKILVILNNYEETAILKQFEAELKEAEINYQRALSLSQKGNISQSILDNRLTEKIRLTGKVDEIKAKINDLVLKAPFDGTIGLRNYSVGAFVKPGDVITTIYDFKTLKVEASVPEAYIGRIKIKDTVKIKVNSSEIVYSGEVYVIDPYVDEKTRTFRIISKIESKKELKPGMMAKKILNFDSKESFLVPESAIIPIDNQTFIYVISDENFIKKVEVFTGKRLDGKVEIKKGLKSSDKIVFEGINKLKAGIKVKIK
tara:strand:- start:221 stop:1225 length:1005 start_codon:yes stop_codon:yes gene_type:complete